MSHTVVRRETKAAIAAWGAAHAPPVEFVDTINRNTRPTTRLWCSAEYYPNYVDPLCYSHAHREESGTIDVTIFSAAGSGDAAGTAAADDLAAHMLALDLTSQGIEIVRTLSAQEAAAGDAEGPHYGVTVSLDYVYRS
jgi:hypothetical protein